MHKHRQQQNRAGKPVAMLLPSGKLEHFILRDQVEDLLRSPAFFCVEPGRIPYGALAKLPRPVAELLAKALLHKVVTAVGSNDLRALSIFHPYQYPLAAKVLKRYPQCELWYWRWDRYENAYDATSTAREKLAGLHNQVASRAALTLAASDRLLELEHSQGRAAELVPLSADSFPAPDPTESIVAVSLGQLGWRNDWSLLRTLCERMPNLTVLMIGKRHDSECRSDPDFRACTELPNLIWLGRRSDQQAARLINCADVGILPFKIEPFNDAGLPYRILKYARQGRYTISAELAGVKTWQRAVHCAKNIDQWVSLLKQHAGRRSSPDPELRSWALKQSGMESNRPVWQRAAQLGITLPIRSGE